MKITIESYEFTHIAEVDEDITCDKFCEIMSHLVSAVWGEDRIIVDYTENYRRLRESIDQLNEVE